MTEVDNLSALALRGLLDRRELSAYELTENYLEIIHRRNPGSNGFLIIESDHALAAAKRADRRLSGGDTSGELLGIPLAIKDIFERTDFEVTAGSRPWTFQSKRTASVVTKLEHAGAIILGTLHLDEFAAGGTGANAHFGRCLNPVDARYQTGGSSSGSAAAVGAGMTPLSLGSDAGGSIRIPAAYCGVTGLKPTYGRVSRHGVVPRTWSMDCVGPLARTALDCGLLLDAIAGVDVNDPTTSDKPGSVLEAATAEPGKISVAIAHELLEDCHPSCQEAVLHVAEQLKDLGIGVINTQFPNIDLLNDMQQIIVKSEGATFLGPKLRDNPALVSESTRAVIQEGFLLPATSYVEALSLRGPLLSNFMTHVLGDADLLLLPVTPGTTPLHSEENERSDEAIDKQFTDSAKFTRFGNYLGLPAIVFPVTEDDDGMPVGVQLIGRPWSEGQLLSTVNQLQK